jgi:cytochrome P450
LTTGERPSPTASSSECPYPELNWFSEEVNENFDEVVSDLLEKCPVVNASGAWLVSRHEDVREVAHDWETFSSARGTLPWNDDGAHFRPTAIDPPLHGYFRQPFLKLFAPRAIEKFEPLMREQARSLTAAIREQGSCDVALDFSREYIGHIFFKGILALDPEVAQKMLVLIYRWLVPPYDETTAAAIAEYGEWVSEVLRSQVDNPARSPVMDAVLSLEIDGEPAPWEDKVNTLSLLIVGGLETTVNSINKALLYLSTHPDLLTELAADPTLIPGATEEFLRMFSPVVGLGRTVTRDTEVAGQVLKQGDKVMIGFGVAARDPRVFDDPMTVDIHRQAQGHLIFGAGIHRCLGSHFARLEIKVALEEFISAIPHFTLDPRSKPHYDTGMNREVSGVRLLVE